MIRHDPAARPVWLMERGGLRVEAEIAVCPLGLWLRVIENGAIAFGLIRPADEEAVLLAEANEQRRAYERRGFVAARPQ